MEMKNIILVVLVLLLIFSVVQAYQVSSLKEKVKTGTISTAANAPASSAPVSSAPAPASSGMVGGC